MKLSFSLAFLVMLLGFFCIEACGQFTPVSSLDEYLSEFPNHQIEDFEDVNVPFLPTTLRGPVNANTDSSLGSDDGVDPGDIVAGLQIQTNVVPGTSRNVLITGPTFFIPSQSLGFVSFETPSPQITVLFLDEDVRGVSLDLVDFTRTPGSNGDLYSIDVFSGNELIYRTSVRGERQMATFFGGIDDQSSISRIELSSRAAVPSFFVDNIRFSSAAAVPEPSMSLIGFLSALLYCGQRRRS